MRVSATIVDPTASNAPKNEPSPSNSPSTKRQWSEIVGEAAQEPEPISPSSSQVDVQYRTMILRRMPLQTTCSSIIKSIILQFKRSEKHTPAEIFESVTRDHEDRRRFYIVFRTYNYKKIVQQTGFTIGETEIPPQIGDVSALIPFVPYYINEKHLEKHFQTYGKIINGSFKQYEGVRVGGYTFNLDLARGQVLPKTIQIGPDTITITDNDEKKQCTHCHKFGHTTQYCNKKKLDDEQKKLKTDLVTDQIDATQHNTTEKIYCDRLRAQTTW